MTSTRLPSNPSTISDLRPRANTWTAASVEAKYAGKALDSQTVAAILQDLDELRAWDNYERCTASNREAAKRALQELLEKRLGA